MSGEADTEAPMRILGLMSGTSYDGIDAAIAECRAFDDILDLSVVAHATTPYPRSLQERIASTLSRGTTTLADVARLDAEIGQAFAQAASVMIRDHGPVDLIVSHGQTMYHWVESGAARGTLQLGEPTWIAEATGVPVLADVRSRDVAAGGQGAPLASTLDALLLGGSPGRSGALNLGGIANVTVVEDSRRVRAWDIGPANTLIDAVVAAHHLDPRGYDSDGRIAARGRVDPDLLRALLDDPYYRLAPPKSTGREHFRLELVDDAIRRIGTVPEPDDLVATLTSLTVRTIADALGPERLDRVFVSGGGVRNMTMMRLLAAALPDVAVRDSSRLGIGADEKEAVLMALLGWMTWHGLPGALASATGARHATILGSITPGRAALRLPEPRKPVHRIRVRSAR